jgi:hypothetical protein
MAHCNYERDGLTIKCRNCGHARPWVRLDTLPQHACGVPGPPPEWAKPADVSLWRKAANFAKAVVKQSPLFVEAALTLDESKAIRSSAEVSAIFEICQQCDLFDGRGCTHRDCGCPIDVDRAAFWSKIAWRSTQCPLKPPKWS